MSRLLSAMAVFVLLLASGSIAAPTETALKAAADYSKSHGGQAMVVMFDGKRVFEQYDNGGAADRPLGLASGSKSFVGVAAMLAVQDGIIKLDDPACQGIAEWRNDPVKSTITYRQLLNMTSGLTRTHAGKGPTAPSWKEQAGKPMAAKPGEHFEYGAFHTNTFAYALEHKLRNETFEDYLTQRILDVIGVKVDFRLRCDDGHAWLGGGGLMTARDWANFGEFICQGGKWNGKQIVDAKLLSECFKGSDQNPAYGLTWWLKVPVREDLVRAIPLVSTEWGEVANCPWLPNDLVTAFGADKQRLYVIPSLKLVIARQGRHSEGFSEVEFLSILLRGTPTTNPS